MHFLTNFILYVYAVTNKRFELAMVLEMLVQILSDDGQDKSHNFQYFEKTSQTGSRNVHGLILASIQFLF